MALNLSIGGIDLSGPLASISITEDATPLTLGDENPAGVGSFTATAAPRPRDQMHFRRKAVEVEIPKRGSYKGRVSSVNGGAGTALTISGESLLGALVADVTALPFHGRLDAAVTYYVDLSGVDIPVEVEAAIAAQVVTFPAFVGPLWEVLAKRIMPVLGYDLGMVDGTVVVRRPRQRQVSVGRLSAASWTQDIGAPAGEVEVAYYGREWAANELLYPGPKGWTGDEEIISVEAGQTIEVVLETPSSPLTLVQPVYQAFVGRYETGSVYTAVGSDDLPVTKAMWEQNGGALSVVPGDEPNEIVVTVTAPMIGRYSPYRIAMSDGEGDYSSLRIRGSGVLLERKSIRVKTGLPTPTVATTTLDDHMVGTLEEAYDIAVRVVSAHLGNGQRIDFASSGLGPTAGGPDEGLTDPQVIGNVAGARVELYEGLYRISTATLGTKSASVSAVLDTTVADVNAMRAGQTIAEANAEMAGAIIRDVNATPLRKDWR